MILSSTQLGNFDDISTLAKKNYDARVAKVRMSPAVKQNSALEADFTGAFRNGNMSPKTLQGGTILMTHLISSDWKVERNEIKGIILYRYQFAQFAVKAADGRCFLYTFNTQQNHKDSGWGSGFPAGKSETEILCENVPKQALSRPSKASRDHIHGRYFEWRVSTFTRTIPGADCSPTIFPGPSSFFPQE